MITDGEAVEIPAWRALRDTALRPHGLYLAGAVIFRDRSPGINWAPANAMAAARQPTARQNFVVKRADPDYGRDRQPYAGLEFSHRAQDGSTVFRNIKRRDPTGQRHGGPRLPCWRYIGAEPMWLWGEARKPRAKIVSADWPSISDLDHLEAVNDEARECLEYLNSHRDDVGRLPDPAWDVARGCLNTIADEAVSDVEQDDPPVTGGAKGITPELQPSHPKFKTRIYSKDPNHPKYR